VHVYNFFYVEVINKAKVEVSICEA